MPNVASKTIAGISDAQILNLFNELGELSNSPAGFAVVGLSQGVKSDDTTLQKLITENIGVIKSAHINGQGFSVNYTARSITGLDGNAVPHPFYSTISVTIGDWYAHNNTPKPDEDKALECNLKISRFIKKHQLDAGALSNDNSSVLEPHLALISKIEAASVEQISKLNDYFTHLTDRFDARNAALTEQTDQKLSELEEEYSSKQHQLEQAKAQFEEARKKLDDRTNTHARRQIRTDLITVLRNRQEDFSISPGTSGLRKPIHAVFVFLLLFTLGGSVWSLYVWGLNPSGNFDAITLTSAVKTAIFSFGFLTTAGLYISWMNRWFDKHAEAQFQTKQFEIDINRASWAVEAALEWKGAQNEQMPDVLLSGITKHLFELTANESADYSPLEALASSILGSASNLKLGVGGNTMDFDRKSIKEIKNKG